MKHTVQAMLAAIVLVVAIGTLWFFFGSKVPSLDLGTVRPSALSSTEPYMGAPLSQAYTNDQFRFSLAIPEGFTAGTLPIDESGGTAIILQNDIGEGIQIYVVPAEGNQKILTAEDIQASIPDLQIEQPEPVAIGSEYTGVAFLSDNDAFGGASREVWFYFRGNLYQISTYARQDILLKAMFATWKFF